MDTIPDRVDYTRMTELAFTGPSKLTPAEADWCRAQLAALPNDCVWRSGAAHGLDTLVVECAHRCWLYAPLGMVFNRALLMHSHVVGNTMVPGGYRKRNERLVKGAAILHAFPRRETFYQSGTWMTINIARRADVPVILHVIPVAALL